MSVPDHADAHAGDQEDAHHRAARGAHGAQDGDVGRFVLHQHVEARDDVERGHHDDQPQDQRP